MKHSKVSLPDWAHYKLDRMTNQALPEREVSNEKRLISIFLTDKVSDTVSKFAQRTGRPPKGEQGKGWHKSELCALLLTVFLKNWNTNPTEFAEIKRIALQIIPEIKELTGKNIGSYKLTKQLIAAAILHRVVSTQDVKEFFSKML